jgi:hypothetical protein
MKTLLSAYRHPSEPLEITIEGDMVEVRRRSTRETEESTAGGIGEGGDESGAIKFENLTVVRKPISSCLKKISPSDADVVNAWIRQLEESGG